MINKKDLVKQFEIVTRQEIINHNNAILEYNKLVNDLQKNLESLSESHKREVDKLKNEIELLNKKFLDVNRQNEKHFRNKDHLSGKIKRVDEETRQLIDNHGQAIRILRKEIDDCFRENLLLYGDLDLIQKEIHLKKNEIEQEQKHTNKKLSSDLKVLKEDFSTKPSRATSEIENIKKEIVDINKTIKSAFEEIKNAKDKRYYNEKQIENLYTLVDRLKAKVE